MVTLDIQGPIAWLTLNRPSVLNALDVATVKQFGVYLKSLRERDDVRVVVTQGEGRAFCAGSDLHEIATMTPAEAAASEREMGDIFGYLDELPQPTIAMLHGYVLGGGLGIALYHDFRISSSETVLGLPEVEFGWTPPWAVGRLVDIVGAQHARMLLLAANKISGEEALTMGLVDKIAPAADLEVQTRQFAEHFAKMPAVGLTETKKLLRKMSLLRDSSWDAEAAKAFEICYSTPEARQRIADFLAKKKAAKK